MHRFVACFFILAVAATASPAPRISDSRIIGGTEIPITQAKYQASLVYLGSHFCGGSVLSATYVVTAAHCTDGLGAGNIIVRVGSASRTSGGQTVSVRAIRQHPNYKAATTDYDISILTVSTITLNANVAPVRLPSASTIWQTGTAVLATGWGTTREGSNTLPSLLQGVSVQVVDVVKCKSAYGTSAITARMLCAGVDAGGKDACQGDSGGPLVANGVLAGITSWGAGCGRRGYPGVYSNVANLRSFITQVTGL